MVPENNSKFDKMRVLVIKKMQMFNHERIINFVVMRDNNREKSLR